MKTSSDNVRKRKKIFDNRVPTYFFFDHFFRSFKIFFNFHSTENFILTFSTIIKNLIGSEKNFIFLIFHQFMFNGLNRPISGLSAFFPYSSVTHWPSSTCSFPDPISLSLSLFTFSCLPPPTSCSEIVIHSNSLERKRLESFGIEGEACLLLYGLNGQPFGATDVQIAFRFTSSKVTDMVEGF